MKMPKPYQASMASAIRFASALAVMSCALLLAACSDSSGTASADSPGSPGSPGSPVTPPAKPTVLLASSYAGTDGMGTLQSFKADDLANATGSHNFAGRPWLSSGGDRDFGLSFNSVDRKFYGVLPATDLRDPDKVAVVVRFDPVTDTVETLGFLSATVPAAGGGPLGNFRRPGVFTADGKGLMLVAIQGGRDARSASADGLQTAGDGALVHLNLDPGSAGYLRLSTVYEFFSFDNGNNGVGAAGLRRVTGTPLLGKDAAGASVIHVVAAGERWQPQGSAARTIPARAVAFKPSDAADWSKPWIVTGNWPSVGSDYWGDNRVGSKSYYDPTTRNFAWAAGDFSFRAGVFGKTLEEGTWSLRADLLSNAECSNPVGVSRLGRRTLLLCSGIDDYHLQRIDQNKPDYVPDPSQAKPATILEFVPATNEFVARNTFSAWDAANTKPLAVTDSTATGRMYVNVGKRSGDIFLQELNTTNDALKAFGYAPLTFPVSSLQSIDAALYFTTTLVTGNETLGRYFVGEPAVGGDSSLADRWIVTFTRHGGKNGVGTILKYDRITGQATAVDMGIAPTLAGAHPIGKPHVLASGRVIGSLSVGKVLVDTDSLGLPVYGGFVTGTADLKPVAWGQLEHCGPSYGGGAFRYRNCPSLALEHVTLANGQVWASTQSPYGGTAIWKVDDATGLPLPSSVITISAGVRPSVAAEPGQVSAAPELDSQRIPAYAPAALGNRLFIIAQRSQEEGRGQRMLCTSSTAIGTTVAWNSVDTNTKAALLDYATGNYEGAHTPVRGGTAFTVNNKMYLMTSKIGQFGTEGRIHEVDLSTCDTDYTPKLVTLVRGLSHLPATKMLQTSDDRLVYGTVDGRLMAFNPQSNMVTELANLTIAGGSAEVRGFLAEVDGAVRGFVRDTAADGRRTMRLISYNLSSGTVTSLNANAQVNDVYPGLVVR
jgi:hypothetical protein